MNNLLVSPQHLEAIGKELNIDASELKRRLDGGPWSNSRVLETFKVDELKKMARYLSRFVKPGCMSNYWKANKKELIEKLVHVLFPDSNAAGPGAGTAPAPSSQVPMPSTSSRPDMYPPQLGRPSQSMSKVGTGHNGHSTSAIHNNYMPPNLMATPGLEAGRRRFRTDPYFTIRKVLVHKEVVQSCSVLSFSLERSWPLVNGEICSVRARFYEFPTSTEPNGILKETGVGSWVMIVNGRTLPSLTKKRKNPELLRHSNYIYAPLSLDNYCQPESNQIRLMQPMAAEREKFIMIVSLGVVKSEAQLLDFVEQKSRDDPLDSMKILRSIIGGGNDDDLKCEEDVKVSLRCPLSYMRISKPGRSKKCTHLQCFDMPSYLEYAKKHHEWLCPVCHIPMEDCDLRIDNMTLAALQGLPQDSDSCIFFEDGLFKDSTAPPTQPTNSQRQMNSADMAAASAPAAKRTRFDLASDTEDGSMDIQMFFSGNGNGEQGDNLTLDLLADVAEGEFLFGDPDRGGSGSGTSSNNQMYAQQAPQNPVDDGIIIILDD